MIEVEPTPATSGLNDAAVDDQPPPMQPIQAAPATPTAEPGAIEFLEPTILETFPHDPNAFTQGLEIVEGQLVESTGAPENRQSDLRRVDIATGAVTQQVDVPGDVFGEGLTRVGDELIQLSWQSQRAFFWDAETFELLREVSYTGQGWGLCFDGERLIMTDGSTQLFFRDPETFELIGQVTVTQSGMPIERLNELECVDGNVWANVWLTDAIVRVDPDTGAITAVVNAASLGQPRTEAMDVLNGIAWDSQTQTWLVTGKLWPELYRVQFVRAG